MSVLLLIHSQVKCILNNKEYCFKNGKDAYNTLDRKYVVTSITAHNEYIVIRLELIESIENHWEEEYKEQFGEEPSFF